MNDIKELIEEIEKLKSKAAEMQHRNYEEGDFSYFYIELAQWGMNTAIKDLNRGLRKERVA